MPLLAAVKAKAAAFVAFLHRLGGHAWTHGLTAVYLLLVAAVAIPITMVVIDWWKPVVMEWHKKMVASASAPPPRVKGKL